MLSRTVALPVIVGAAVLKALGCASAACRRPSAARSPREPPRPSRSTLASQELIRPVERDRALWPYAAYRAALAALVAGAPGCGAVELRGPGGRSSFNDQRRGHRAEAAARAGRGGAARRAVMMEADAAMS